MIADRTARYSYGPLSAIAVVSIIIVLILPATISTTGIFILLENRTQGTLKNITEETVMLFNVPQRSGDF